MIKYDKKGRWSKKMHEIVLDDGEMLIILQYRHNNYLTLFKWRTFSTGNTTTTHILRKMTSASKTLIILQATFSSTLVKTTSIRWNTDWFWIKMRKGWFIVMMTTTIWTIHKMRPKTSTTFNVILFLFLRRRRKRIQATNDLNSERGVLPSIRGQKHLNPRGYEPRLCWSTGWIIERSLAERIKGIGL